MIGRDYRKKPRWPVRSYPPRHFHRSLFHSDIPLSWTGGIFIFMTDSLSSRGLVKDENSRREGAGAVERLEFAIIDYIGERWPECWSPSSRVTRHFIELVDAAMDEVILQDQPDLEGCDLGEGISEEEEAILAGLPEKAKKHPLTHETVHLILRERDDMLCRSILVETADTRCVRAWEFNNRANARAELGRSLEALKNYNLACDMEPNQPDLLLNRAGFLRRLEAIKDALEDAARAYRLIEGGGIEHDMDFLHLASIFMACGEMHQAMKAFSTILKSLASSMKRGEYGVLRLETSRDGIHLCGPVDLEGILGLAEEMEEALDDSDVEARSVMAEIGRDISGVTGIVDSL